MASATAGLQNRNIADENWLKVQFLRSKLERLYRTLDDKVGYVLSSYSFLRPEYSIPSRILLVFGNTDLKTTEPLHYTGITFKTSRLWIIHGEEDSGD